MGDALMADYRTSLARVRGLGTTRGGTEHFWLQRLTGLANLILLVFLIFTVIRLAGEPYAVMRAYFASPFAVIPALALAISAPYHMRIGMQVIIEDYIHGEAKMPLLILNTFFAAAVALTCIVSLIKLSLGA
jgi:succinate dehydrogenase / fumarate reductase membrane anchor subunit